MKQNNTVSLVVSSLVAISVNATALWLYRRSKTKAIAASVVEKKQKKEAVAASKDSISVIESSDKTTSISDEADDTKTVVSAKIYVSSRSTHKKAVVAAKSIVPVRSAKIATNNPKTVRILKSPQGLKLSKAYPKTPLLRKQSTPAVPVVIMSPMAPNKGAATVQSQTPFRKQYQQPLPKSPLMDATNNITTRTSKSKSKKSQKKNMPTLPRIRDSLLPASIRENIVKQRVEQTMKSPVRQACTNKGIVQLRQKLYLSRTSTNATQQQPIVPTASSRSKLVRVRDSLLPSDIRQKVLAHRETEQLLQVVEEDKENPMVSSRRPRQQYQVRDSLLPDSLKRNENGILLSNL